MSEVLKLQRRVQELTQRLGSRDELAAELRLKDGLLRKHQERVQRLREECEAGARELRRCKEENYDLALRLARRSEEKGAALTHSRDLQLEVPAPGRRVAGRRGEAGRLTRPPAGGAAQALPHEGGGRLPRGAQEHAEAAARRGAAAQPGAGVGAAAGEDAAAGACAGAGGHRAGAGWPAGQARPGAGAPGGWGRCSGKLDSPAGRWSQSRARSRFAASCRSVLFTTPRKRSQTRAAPTSRCWRGTGGRRCGTTKSRPTPSCLCARPCGGARPCTPGYVAGWAEGLTAPCPRSPWDPHPDLTPSWRCRGMDSSPHSWPVLPQDGQAPALVRKFRAGRDPGAPAASPYPNWA